MADDDDCCGGCCRSEPTNVASGGRRCFRPLLVLFLLSAVPLGLIVSLERSATGFAYQSRGWIRECAKWDPDGRRFLVSTFFEGGVSEVAVAAAETDLDGALALEERPVVSDPDVAGNASLGIAVDQARGRLLVVYADLRGLRFAAIAAYDLKSWGRLFLTQLSGPGDEASFADDVAVDEFGSAYVTDAKANKIWKVDLNGKLISVIRNKAFTQRKEWYYNFVGLNGIVYHPNGYLLVIHTASGYLLKVNTANEEVAVVKVSGSLLMGDGLEFLSSTKLVIAGMPYVRVVESSDNWETAKVIERYVGPVHRIPSSATVKDGRVYINHLIGAGLKKTHVIAEGVFLPLEAK